MTCKRIASRLAFWLDLPCLLQTTTGFQQPVEDYSQVIVNIDILVEDVIAIAAGILIVNKSV